MGVRTVGHHEASQAASSEVAPSHVESLRGDLAAAFRWAARLDLHEGVANHFSVAVSDDGGQFLLNPRGRHFSRVRASELLLLDATRSGADADPTAWFLHSHLHRHVPHARAACCTLTCRTRRRSPACVTSSS